MKLSLEFWCFWRDQILVEIWVFGVAVFGLDGLGFRFSVGGFWRGWMKLSLECWLVCLTN